jgi:hypothetical protein
VDAARPRYLCPNQSFDRLRAVLTRRQSFAFISERGKLFYYAPPGGFDFMMGVPLTPSPEGVVNGFLIILLEIITKFRNAWFLLMTGVLLGLGGRSNRVRSSRKGAGHASVYFLFHTRIIETYIRKVTIEKEKAFTPLLAVNFLAVGVSGSAIWVDPLKKIIP